MIRKGRRIRKGQISVIDFLLAISLYAVILALTISLVTVEQGNSRSRSRQEALWAAGTAITDTLAMSSGVPTNWETNIASTQAIGLADTANRLSVLKVTKFVTLDYNTSKTLMGLPRGTDYHFSITDTNGTVLKQSGIDSNVSDISLSFTRYVIWNGSRAWMRLRIYE